MEYCAFLEPQQGATYDHLLAVARAAERHRFTGLFRSDHYLVMGTAMDGSPGPSDAWITLAGLARDTERLRLGTLVSSVTYRHPSILAISVANVDAMSGGRVELGLGTGWFEAEHRAYGLPFPEKRFGLLEEQLAIVTGLWSTPVGETFDFHGEHYALEQSPGLPKPVQGRVPLIVGGGGASRTPALAARFATEFNSFAGPAESARRFGRVRAAAEAIDRDPGDIKLSIAVQVVLGADRAEVKRRAERAGVALDRSRGDDAVVSGTPSEVAGALQPFLDSGIGRLYLQFLDPQDADHVELAGAELLPLLP